jgi:tRNA dimethylallyltransferase
VKLADDTAVFSEGAVRVDDEALKRKDDGGGGGGGGVAEEPAWEERRCDACERTLRGDAEWRAHVSGRRHRKRVASLRKKREGKHGVPPREKGCSDAG